MDAGILAEVAAGIENALKPYEDEFAKYDRIPDMGKDREEILDLMEQFKAIEAGRWQDGFVSGAVYNGNEAHIDFMNRVYAINSQSNPLHPEIGRAHPNLRLRWSQ